MSSPSFGFRFWLRRVGGASFCGAGHRLLWPACPGKTQTTKNDRLRHRAINRSVQLITTNRLWLRELLIFVLKLIKLPINSAHGQQFLMRSYLAELTLVHHQDSIRTLDG